MLKVALLGGGSICSVHINGWKELEKKGKAQVIAVADLLPDRRAKLANMFFARQYEQADDLLANEKPDVVDVCLPTALHVEYSIKAMRHGADVLCEKPLTLTEELGRTLLDVQKETGRRMMVAHCIRFSPEHQYLRRVVEEQPYGKLLSLALTRMWGRRNLGLAWKEWPSHEELSGSCVFDVNIHDLDFMRSLLGEPDTLFAELYYHHDNPEHMFSLYRYGKTVVSIETGWDFPRGGIWPGISGYRAIFERGVLNFDIHGADRLCWYIEDGIKRPVKPTDNADGTPSGITEPLPGMYTAEIAYFADCLEKGLPFSRCTLEDAIQSVRLTQDTVAFAKARVPKD